VDVGDDGFAPDAAGVPGADAEEAYTAEPAAPPRGVMIVGGRTRTGGGTDAGAGGIGTPADEGGGLPPAGFVGCGFGGLGSMLARSVGFGPAGAGGV
jgi:hypothetical protein